MSDNSGKSWLERFNAMDATTQQDFFERLQILPLETLMLPLWRKIPMIPSLLWKHYKLNRKLAGRIYSVYWAFIWVGITIFPAPRNNESTDNTAKCTKTQPSWVDLVVDQPIVKPVELPTSPDVNRKDMPVVGPPNVGYYNTRKPTHSLICITVKSSNGGHNEAIICNYDNTTKLDPGYWKAHYIASDFDAVHKIMKTDEMPEHWRSQIELFHSRDNG